MTTEPLGDLAIGPRAAPRAGPLASALVAARTALREAGEAARHLGSLSASEHLAALDEVAHLQWLTDAVTASLVVSLDGRERRELEALGLRSTTAALARSAGSSDAAARRRLTLALSARPDRTPGDRGDRTSPALPVLGEVLARAEISTDVFEVAVRTVRALPAALRREHLPEADALLAATLPGLSHAEATTLCSRLLDELDPDRAERGFDHEDLEKRYLRWTRHDDGWLSVHAQLAPDVAAQFVAAVDHLSRAKRPRPAEPADVDADGTPLPGSMPRGAPGAAPRGAPGGVPEGDRDGGREVLVIETRTAGQRRADALGVLARQGLSHLETRGGEPPRVIVTATQAQAQGAPGAGRAVCEQTGPLPAAALRLIMSRAVIQAVTLSGDPAGASVLSMGRGVRLFTPQQRRAIYARDGGCVFGCDTPLAQLEAHHVLDWADGGPTDVGNGVLACPHEHTLIGLGVWEVRVVSGVPQIRPPAGIDPLRRWRWAPRRAIRSRAVALGEQLLLGVALNDPPDAWRYAAPPDDPLQDPPGGPTSRLPGDPAADPTGDSTSTPTIDVVTDPPPRSSSERRESALGGVVTAPPLRRRSPGCAPGPPPHRGARRRARR